MEKKQQSDQKLAEKIRHRIYSQLKEYAKISYKYPPNAVLIDEESINTFKKHYQEECLCNDGKFYITGWTIRMLIIQRTAKGLGNIKALYIRNL